MHERGFSLIELLTALALLVLLLPLSSTTFSELLSSNRQQDAARTLASDLRNARAAAIQHRHTTLVHAMGGGWSQGWRVILDISGKGAKDPENPLIMERRGTRGIAIEGNRPVQDFVRFGAMGSPLLPTGAFQAGTLHICQRAREGSLYQVVLSRSGRISLRNEIIEQASCTSPG
ncbi:GspH/FimT family protein [Pseudomonas sessilinigenes]|uniref:Type II secretion system protein H n=1 Tax=Pseudomonas sessilinigenes TaxID=658629 RepID=A0ABX8MR48_9PSED|nr:GspH/FimT family protein [Pseudomonas sessilinigenes]AZC25996.1 Type IV fimbrial biogenesis protein FimT [Pseudomonas sessilinigenes]QXH39970.1 GspH/FimT family protein [Pseudomonas sessilinigenes]